MPEETRRPLLISFSGAAGLLGLFQGAFLFFRNQDFGSPEMALGLARIAMMLAFITIPLRLSRVEGRRRGEGI
jgi:hypothetical protein